MEDDIRATIQAAMAGESATVADGPEAVQAAPEAAPAQLDEATQQPVAEGAQRDANGRFAKSDSLAQTEVIEPAGPADPAEPPSETTRVPASLPAPLKAAFKTLDPQWQAVLLAQEDQFKATKDEWGKKGERLNRYDEIFAPRREKLQLQGVDEFTAVQTLFAAQDLLERSPLEGLQYLARSYGVDLGQAAQQTNGNPQHPGQQPGPDLLQHPALQGLAQQVQALTQTFTQQQQQAEQRQRAEAQDLVDAFKSDPKNLYFDNVKGEVAALLQSGQAQTLEQAYERAIWASPEIRPLLLKAQQASTAPVDPIASQQAKAAAAARAAGSVTGAPGSASLSLPASTGNLRADLEAAADMLGARVG